jgi:hypothetical protein
MSDPAAPDRPPYPLEMVAGTFGDEQSVQRAVGALRRAGFQPADCDILHGAEDAESLDVTGEAHGLRGRVIRALQAASSSDLDHVRHHAQHLRAGGYVIGVDVGEDEEAKRRAAGALRAGGGEFLHYYADLYIESLGDQ